MSRRRGTHGWFFRLSMAFALLMILACLVMGASMGYLWWQWSSTPRYWQANQTFAATHSHAQLQQIADRAFNRWVSELTGPIDHDPIDHMPAPPAPPARKTPNKTDHRPTLTPDATHRRSPNAHARPPMASPQKLLHGPVGTRTLHLRPEQINAWLEARLPDWLANQGLHLPPGVSDPMVAIENGKPVIAFSLHARHIDNVISVVLDPKLESEGELSLRIDSIRGGRLPMPVDQLISKAKQLAPNHKSQIDRAISILEDGKTFEPVVKLDARQARLVGLAIHNDSIDLTILHEKLGTGLKHAPPQLPGLSP